MHNKRTKKPPVERRESKAGAGGSKFDKRSRHKVSHTQIPFSPRASFAINPLIASHSRRLIDVLQSVRARTFALLRPHREASRGRLEVRGMGELEVELAENFDKIGADLRAGKARGERRREEGRRELNQFVSSVVTHTHTRCIVACPRVPGMTRRSFIPTHSSTHTQRALQTPRVGVSAWHSEFQSVPAPEFVCCTAVTRRVFHLGDAHTHTHTHTNTARHQTPEVLPSD